MRGEAQTAQFAVDGCRRGESVDGSLFQSILFISVFSCGFRMFSDFSLVFFHKAPVREEVMGREPTDPMEDNSSIQ